MSSNDDNSQRDSSRSEDNPFIAFRRFADSQFSQLFNTVLTLPDVMAHWSSQRQRAYDNCLFGKAEPRDCKKLVEVEQEYKETKEMFNEIDGSNGTPEEKRWLKADFRERLELLEMEQDRLRQTILRDTPRHAEIGDRKDVEREQVEAFANKKGHEWASEWDWVVTESNNRSSGDNESVMTGNRSQIARRDAGERTIGPVAFLNDLSNMFADEMARMMRPFTSGSHGSYHYQNPTIDLYSPEALENDERMQKAGVIWRDAFEDLLRVEVGASLIPKAQLGKSRSMPYHDWIKRLYDPNCPSSQTWNPNFPPSHFGESTGQYPRRVQWEGEERSEEPSYEYAHDHEDQHDDPPTPKQGKFARGMPETELEAYERVLGSSSTNGETTDGSRPSLVSVHSTMERTISPDGIMNTKMVHKKRFADGSEEISESVHTQRADEPRLEANFEFQQEDQNSVDANKKGWFWSN